MRGWRQAAVLVIPCGVLACSPGAAELDEAGSYLHTCGLKHVGGDREGHTGSSVGLYVGFVQLGSNRHIAIWDGRPIDAVEYFERRQRSGTTVYTSKHTSPDTPPSVLTVRPDGAASFTRVDGSAPDESITHYAGTCQRGTET